MELVDVAIAAIFEAGRVLICRRADAGPLAGYWELPGGKCRPDESAEQCLHRELSEELRVSVNVVRSFAPIEHQYPHVAVRLHAFLACLASGRPQAVVHSQLLWVRPEKLPSYRFPAANAWLLPQIIAACAALDASGA